MPDRKKRLLWYLVIHLSVLLYGGLILLWLSISRRIGFAYFCLSHDFLGIYCPFCGGTRALSSLLRLDFASAVRFHAALVLALPLLVLLDVRALCLTVRNRHDRVLFPIWARVALVSAFVVYFILRNVLMLAFGIDWTGDFQ